VRTRTTPANSKEHSAAISNIFKPVRRSIFK